MAMTPRNGHNNGIHELDAEESHALFDQAARYYLNMSGEEFLRQYDAGKFDEEIDVRPELRRMEMLIPFGR